MSYFDDETQHEVIETTKRPTKKRQSKSCWRDIEQFKENSRYAREVVDDDEKYFDLLERYTSVY